MTSRLFRLLALAAALAATFATAPAFGDGCFVPRADSREVRERSQAGTRKLREPNQKAILSHIHGVEDLILQVRYSGATGKFAWLVPTPTCPMIGQAPKDIFSRVARLIEDLQGTRRRGEGFGGFMGGGFGGGMGAPPPVTVVERAQVGIYDISVLSARDAGALIDWLNRNGYAVSTDLRRVCAGYIAEGWFFTAVRIDPERAAGDEARTAALLADGDIQPIRLTFASGAPVYPLRISSLNDGRTEVLLYLVTTDPVRAPFGFSVAFQRRVTQQRLASATDNTLRFGQPMWLTQMSRTMRPEAMDYDLTFVLQPTPGGGLSGSRPMTAPAATRAAVP